MVEVGQKTLWYSVQPGEAVLPSLVYPPGKGTRGSRKCRVSTRWHQTQSSVPMVAWQDPVPEP